MPDLGTKYECTACGTKFYDMGRADAVCPKCSLNPLTDEVEEIVEEEPAAEEAPAAEPDAAEAKTPSDDDEGVGVDLDVEEDEDE